MRYLLILALLISPAFARPRPPSKFFLYCAKHSVPAPKACRVFDGRP